MSTIYSCQPLHRQVPRSWPRIHQAQHTSSDLLGSYAIRDKVQLKEFIKVSQDSGAVMISEKQKNGSR